MSRHLVTAADALGTAIALIEAIDMAAAGAMDMDEQERSALRTLVSVAGDTARHALTEINKALGQCPRVRTRGSGAASMAVQPPDGRHANIAEANRAA